MVTDQPDLLVCHRCSTSGCNVTKRQEVLLDMNASGSQRGALCTKLSGHLCMADGQKVKQART